MKILGINAFHGDASAALLVDGNLKAAVEEERFNRIKHCAGLPSLAVLSCMDGADSKELEHVAISRDPRAYFWKKLWRVVVRPRCWKRSADRASNHVRVARLNHEVQTAGVPLQTHVKVHFVEHHRAHLASTFFASPFEEAAVVSVDGFGDFSSVMWGVGSGNEIKVLGSVQFPHSLGTFYTAFTQFLGFPKYGDEYKMMGLAAYGMPVYNRQVSEVIRTVDGCCKLDLDYFTHHTHGDTMTWDHGAPELGPIFSQRMINVFGTPRQPYSDILSQHAHLACSVQAVLEENYFSLLNYVYKQTRQKKLCLAGGVALNCAANGKIFEMTPFQEVYVQPAAHDAGTSIGAALYVCHQILQRPRSFVMRHVYYGPEYSEEDVQAELKNAGLVHQRLDNVRLVDQTAREIADGKIVGWFQGRMEFGPRALGNRSILADPRRKDMKDVLNRRIKYREPFRPFCPSVLAEATGDYFEPNYPSPFMVMAYKIKPYQRDRIPAVTHGDGTGRLQTVEREVNPLYWFLIKRFEEITGVPVLLNTSFNENEPIVNTPAEAIDCFLRTQMDVLVIGPYFMSKSENLHRCESKRAFAETAVH
jgi:carbamoyltransferase